MSPYLAVLPVLLFLAASMLLLFSYLSYKFIRHRLMHSTINKPSIHLVLILTTLICFLCGIVSICFTVVHLWMCKITDQTFTECYTPSTYSKIADYSFYTVHLSLYIHLIFGRLKISLSGTYYGYSNTALCLVSLPIWISLPCIIVYQHPAIVAYTHSALTRHIALFTAIAMDSILNLMTLYLFIRALKNVIMANSSSFEDYLKPNYLEPSADLYEYDGGEVRPNTMSLQYVNDEHLQVFDEEESEVDVDGVIQRNMHKITFTDTPLEKTIQVITRITVLSVWSIVSNQLYYVLVLIWHLVMKDSDVEVSYVDVWIMCVYIGRALDLCVDLVCLYLFVYKISHNAYYCLCGKCDILCYQCTKQSTKRQFIRKSLSRGLSLQ